MIEDPSMHESAIASHELYLEFREAGFTECQALRMITGGTHCDECDE